MMSYPTMLALDEPCFPVLEIFRSATWKRGRERRTRKGERGRKGVSGVRRGMTGCVGRGEAGHVWRGSVSSRRERTR